MKTTRFFVMAMVAMLGVGLVSCGNENNGGDPSKPDQPGDGWVNLGLPSGVQWATCNVGADTPEKYGNYFAWGETATKSNYNWETYKYCVDGAYDQLTKYCNDSDYGYDGFTDNLTTLQPMDDAATTFDPSMRTPTAAEWQELIDNTTAEWTKVNGVGGVKFTASNGNSIFLPAAGNRWDGELYYAGSYGKYWSRSLYTVGPDIAWNLYFGSDDCGMVNIGRYSGFSVRPVREN